MKTARIIGSFMIGMMAFLLADNIAAQTICDSIVAIDSIYYYKHQLPYTIIDTTNLPKKIGHEIVVPFGDSVLRFKDEKYGKDEKGEDYYIGQFDIIGMDKKRNWVLVEEGSPILVTHYLINSTNKTIDTLIGNIFIYGKRMINLDYRFTGDSWTIELREIVGNKVILKRKFWQANGRDFFPNGIAISNKNELLIMGRNEEKELYYKIKL